MWQCSKCGADVDEGVELCWNCICSPEDPPEETDTTAAPLVPIAAFSSLEEAEQARLQLESEGIMGYVTDEPALESNWFSAENADFVQLLVSETDVESAQRVLIGPPATEAEPEAGAPIEAEPETVEPIEAEPEAGAPWVTPIPVIDELIEAPAAEPQTAAPAAPPTFRDQLRSFESKLSALMDDKETPDWTVNPAYHPDVIEFIARHSSNRTFVQRAQALQENRASYYETMRARSAGAKPIENYDPGQSGPKTS